jgi:hypothetical protein
MGNTTLPQGVSRKKKKAKRDTEAQAAGGRKGGKSRSPAKVAAVRENGKQGGRPSKYLPEYCEQVIEFFKRDSTRMVEVARYKTKDGTEVVKNAEVGVVLPVLSDFACLIGVAPRTMDGWREAHPEFKEAVEIALAHQQRMVIQNGMLGHYMQPMAVLYMKNNAGWRDQLAVTGADGGAIKTEDVSLIRAEHEKRTEALLKKLEQQQRAKGAN